MPDDLVSQLRDRKLRVTPQRRAILGAFAGTADEHLSADEVHARAAAVVPELGRGTVYATLAELTELGMLAAQGSPEPVRFETNVVPHEHFRCRLCLRLFDVALPAPDTDALTRQGYVVERIATVAEGVCADCREYERGLTDGIGATNASPLVGDDLVGTLACARHDTVLGPLLLGATADGIVRIAFEEAADFGPFDARAKTRRGGRAARDRVDAAAKAIDAYLSGDRHPSEDVVDWAAAKLRSPEALEATRRIPYGDRRSYERLGVDVAPYDLGYAIGTNPMPLLFPCHRVTRGRVRLDAYIGGIERRGALEQLEIA